MNYFDIIQRRPQLFFRVLALFTFLGALAVWGRVDYINAYEVHIAISHGVLGVVISILFLLISIAYDLLLRRKKDVKQKSVRGHILFSIVGPLGSLPVFLLGRRIVMPITDLLQYAADMQFNDRLMLLSVGLWLITLLRQVMFLIQFFRVCR